jgi:glycosyltransferase involved in cell wall biosynthesis
VPIRIAMSPGPYHLESDPLRAADMATQWMDHRLVSGSRCIDDIYESLGVPARRRRIAYYGPNPARFDPDRADAARVRREFGVSDSAPFIGQVAFFYPVADGPFVPSAVRGLGIKGHDDFVEAARIVLQVRADARFLLVGDGWGPSGEEYRVRMIQKCRKLGIGDAVIFTGRRVDVPDILAALDVSVQCSLNENLGGTIESLLMRAPTIATRVGGMPESVLHERTGLLVPPRDPESLAASMLRLIDDPALGRRLGVAGREFMLERFTLERTVEDVVGIYRDVCWERNVRRAPLG